MYCQVTVCNKVILKQVEVTGAQAEYAKNNLGKCIKTGSKDGSDVYSYFIYLAE